MSEEASAFDLQFENRPGYLYATLACRALDAAIALEILSDVMSHAATTRHKRIMVQCDLGSIEDDAPLLSAMLDLASMRSGSRIAFVNCKHTDREHPALSDDFKLFDDDQETAEAWLLAAEPRDVTRNPSL